MTSKLTREKVQWLHDAAEEAAAVGIKLTMNPNELLMFTSYALAAMDSEPVAVTDDELNAALQLHRLKVDGHSQLSDAFRAGFRYARRTTPQPAPVVPEKCPAEIRDLISSHTDALFNDDDAQEIWNACRSAMLAAIQQEVKGD
ncbi:hypothetical protein R9D63_001091 [Klebsiella oxytoca]|nr:hypothetical protein [Klebsiella oxytoca]HEJ8490382.1 hypothetical protein [Klebsiella oxytoca]